MASITDILEFLDDEKIERLSKKITEEYYELDKGALRRWGSVGKEKTLYSTKKTLKKLETFVYLNDIQSFIEYMDWLVLVMTSRNIKFKIIYEHTNICYKVMKLEARREKLESKKKSAEKCIQFLEAGINHLDVIKNLQKIA